MPECLHASHLLRLNSAENSIDPRILLQLVAIPFPTLEGLGNFFQIKYSIALELFLLQMRHKMVLLIR